MASYPIAPERLTFPGKTDEQIASALAHEYGYVAVVRYKSSASSDYDHFGCCKHDYEVEGYFNSPYCQDTEVIYDGRKPSAISQLIGLRFRDTPLESEYSEEELNKIYLQANHDDYLIRLETILRLSRITTDKAYYELVQTAALDFKGELRIAAVVALAAIRNKSPICRFLKEWVEKFNRNEAKMAPLLALSIIEGYDIDKALNLGFKDKEHLIQNIKKSGDERANFGVDRIAFYLVYFFGLDGGGGNKELVETIAKYFPDFKTLFYAILKWMKMSL